jgi:transcriptional regulator with XRE-family HTH domain
MAESKASKQLRELLSPKLTQVELAERLQVTQQAVSSWVSGRTAPKRKYMAALEDLAGIPMRAWTEPPAEQQSKGRTRKARPSASP